MDESIDCCDTAELVIYIQGIDKDFNISGELAAMLSMKDRSVGKDICTELFNYVNKKLAYSFTNLVAILHRRCSKVCEENILKHSKFL